MKLDIIPGKTVVESGTGSGSLSSSILNSLQGRPKFLTKGEGFLYTFEFNEDRAKNAEKVF